MVSGRTGEGESREGLRALPVLPVLPVTEHHRESVTRFVERPPSTFGNAHSEVFTL